ncbi:hypothetical protein [Vibrio cidicii]|nr:hypothetical protein [Vibrio cidicii]
MNIKQSVTLLLLLMGVSFSALFFSIQAQAQDLYRVVRIEDSRMSCAYKEGSISNRSYPSQALLCRGNKATYNIKALPDRPGLFGIFTDGSKIGYYHTPVVLQPFSCPDGTEFNPDTGKCEEPPLSCADTAEGHVVKGQTWPFKTYGSDPRVCAGGCIYKLHVLSLCFPEGGFCTGDMIGTSEECTNDGIEPGNNTPDPCEPKEGGGYSCNKDIDGDGQPDADGGLDPDADCGFDSQGKFGCTGGSYDKDPDTGGGDGDGTDTGGDTGGSQIEDPSPFDPVTSTPADPRPVDPEPDVSTPVTGDPNNNIVQSIVNMNKQVNKALHDLNEDNNANFAEVNTNLKQISINTDTINSNIALQLQQDVDLHREAIEKMNENTTKQNEHLTKELTELKEALTQDKDDLKEAINGTSDSSLASRIEKSINGTDSNSLTSQIKKELGSLSAAVGTSNETQTTQLKGALEEQTGALQGSIDGQTEALQGALDAQKGAIDGLSKAIGDMAGKMPEKCEPTAANNYCENPHGLTSDAVGDMFTQADDAFGKALSGASSSLGSTLKEYSEKDLIDKEIFTKYFDNVLGFIPDAQECQPIEFFGLKQKIDCRPFVIFKEIFGFFLFMLTIMFVIDTILYDFTPQGIGLRRS